MDDNIRTNKKIESSNEAIETLNEIKVSGGMPKKAATLDQVIEYIKADDGKNTQTAIGLLNDIRLSGYMSDKTNIDRVIRYLETRHFKPESLSSDHEIFGGISI